MRADDTLKKWVVLEIDMILNRESKECHSDRKCEKIQEEEKHREKYIKGGKNEIEIL